MVKMFVNYSGTKAAFIAAGLETTYANKIVFIKGGASGKGECIFTHGNYFGNFAELIAALNFVKGISVGGQSYNAAQGGGYVAFAAKDPSTVAVNAGSNGIEIGLTEEFIQSVDDVIALAGAINADYLKASDRTALEGLISTAKSEAKSEAVAEVKGNAATDTKDSLTIEGVRKYVDDKTSGIASDAVVSEISGRVKAIEDDYLKTADKTELQGAINTEKGRVDAIVADYLKVADKTELEGKIKSNTDAIAQLNGNSSVEGSVDKKVADAINDFATKISDDQTVNTFKELVDYAAEHGTEFSELVGEVDANAKAIQTLNGDSSVAGSVDKKLADAMASEVERANNLYATKQNLTDGVAEAKSHAETKASDAQSAAEAKAAELAGAAETNAKGYADGLAGNYATAAQGAKADAAAPQATTYTKDEVDAMWAWEEL